MVKSVPSAKSLENDDPSKNSYPVLKRDVKVFLSVDKIGRDSINSISNDGFFTYEWFKTLETQESFPISPIYLAVYEESKMIAFAPCFIDLSNEYFIFGPRVRYALQYLGKFLNLGQRVGFCQNHVLVCFSPYCFRSKILFEKNSEEKMLLSLLSAKIDEICKKQKILFSSFLFVSEFDGLLMKNLENQGYLKSPGVTTLNLNVQWSSFEDYLNRLKCHTRRKIRREIKKCSESGVTIKEREFGNLSEKLSELLLNNQDKHYKNSKCIFGPSFFSKLNEHAKEKTIVFIAEKNNEVVGFSLSLWHKDVIDVAMCGFDYDLLTKTDFTYFNAVYYAPLQLAIEKGIRKMYYRFKAEKVKIDRGCKPEKTYSFVKCHNDFMRAVINNAAKNPPYSYLKKRLLMESL